MPIPVILLAAGRPAHGSEPTLLRSTASLRVIDWIKQAYAGHDVAFHLVGGFKAESLLPASTGLTLHYNPQWEKSGAVGSFLLVPIQEKSDCILSYTDVLYRPKTIDSLIDVQADIVLALDSKWEERFPDRSPEDKHRAELFTPCADRLRPAKWQQPEDPHNCLEFTGVVKLSPAAWAASHAWEKNASAASEQGLRSMLLYLLSLPNLSIAWIDVQGQWAELNAPQDRAKFILGTKAESLERLRPLVQKSLIKLPYSCTVAQWRKNESQEIARIQKTFPQHKLAVRSSSFLEDGWQASQAGKFHSALNVDSGKASSLREAMEAVIASYPDENGQNQVLIQEMVGDVVRAGVIFTRSLEFGSPYYTINYEEGHDTASVTSGCGKDLKTVYLCRHVEHIPHYLQHLGVVLEAVREVETLVGHDSLDIEFAQDSHGQVHILQVRPIAVDHKLWTTEDPVLEDWVEKASQDFTQAQLAMPGTAGSRTIWGLMPDWNPAEIIGTKPRPLAGDLYRWLITDEAWAIPRQELGFRDMRHHPLLRFFMGVPYVDVRASLNSFLPARLPDSLAGKIVDTCLNILEAKPQWHDKLEFNIIPTSYDLDWERHKKVFLQHGVSAQNCENWAQGLKIISLNTIHRVNKHEAPLQAMEQALAELRKAPPSLRRASQALHICRRWGTPSFAHLARAGFVAISFLRSAVSAQVIDAQSMESFMASLRTVAGDQQADRQAMASQDISKEAFLKKYGHLRPGTYEISILPYSADPDFYLKEVSAHETNVYPSSNSWAWPDNIRSTIECALHSLGLKVPFSSFSQFLKNAIEGREMSKFRFTQALSLALEDIAQVGAQLGLDRNELSYLPLALIQDAAYGRISGSLEIAFKKSILEQQELHATIKGVELPPLLIKAEDFYAFSLPESTPNYIGQAQVLAPVAVFSDQGQTFNPTGCIAVIPNADPGFDWLFNSQLAGLITMYGGANSHMAIRAAEFGLPAAIGVGEKYYSKCRRSSMLKLDCQARTIESIL